MGFSVSASFAILVLAGFIAFGMVYTAGSNGFEQVTDATSESYETELHRQNTAIEIVGLDYANESDTLVVNVTNEGTTALAVDATDLIVDGVYHSQDEYDSLLVDGQADTGIWLSGERLSVRINVTGSTPPARVKVVTEHGIADVEVVS